MTQSTPHMDGKLRIYGNLSLLEMAPVLLAARRDFAGKTVIEHGGVMSLWGKPYDLPSLDAAGKSDIAANSETQVLRSSFGNPDLRIIFTLAVCPYRIICRRSAGIALNCGRTFQKANSVTMGAWSDGLPHPRTCLCTTCDLAFSFKSGVTHIWSSRRPRSDVSQSCAR